MGYCEPIYRIIGKRIKDARLNQGMSQLDLALEIGVSETSIWHFENATRRVYVHHLISLEKFFHKQLYLDLS
jgi:transcriptional regulator with XRE-family HTH domain